MGKLQTSHNIKQAFALWRIRAALVSCLLNLAILFLSAASDLWFQTVLEPSTICTGAVGYKQTEDLLRGRGHLPLYPN